MARSGTNSRRRQVEQTQAGEATAPQPRGEHELDQDTEWDRDWPEDDDGDWSGCVNDGGEDG